jgi:allophanate hydrolase subunit 1
MFGATQNEMAPPRKAPQRRLLPDASAAIEDRQSGIEDGAQ